MLPYLALSRLLLYPLVKCSSRDVADGSLHPQLGILSVQELNVERHRLASCLAESLVEDTLELELGNTLVFQDLCSHLEQSVTGSDLHLARRVSAADDDRLGCLGEHFEMVCDLCANRVIRVQEGLGIPHLVLCVGIAVLLLEVLALVRIAYMVVSVDWPKYPSTCTHQDLPRHRRRISRPAFLPSQGTRA
jgi:hypothetical protein